MIRMPILAAGAAALALTAFAAQAGGILSLGQSAEPAIYRDANTPLQNRMLAKAALTEVLSRKANVLGMLAPQNLPAYAPIYPNGLILEETASAVLPTGGSLNYDAAAPLMATLDFYEDAAALNHLPFSAVMQDANTVLFKAGAGRRQVQAKLTKQFANSTVVELSYG